jgi:hypothetical protein
MHCVATGDGVSDSRVVVEITGNVVEAGVGSGNDAAVAYQDADLVSVAAQLPCYRRAQFAGAADYQDRGGHRGSSRPSSASTSFTHCSPAAAVSRP